MKLWYISRIILISIGFVLTLPMLAAENWHDLKIISDGTRLTIGEEGEPSRLSVVPPAEWEVYTQHPSLTLLMQAQKVPELRYQRTIQVASFQGSRFIDDMTAQEYEKLITKKFSELSAAVEEYRIRDHHFIEVKDGRPALLFYSEFTMDSVAMMQAHILVSDQAKHYLVTFTDTADHFEEERFANYLNEAWDAMISLELASPAPGRYDDLMKLGFYGVGVIMLLLTGWFVRYLSAVKKYRQLESEQEDDMLESTDLAEATTGSVSGMVSDAGVPLEAVALQADAVETEHKGDEDSLSLFTTRHPRHLFKRMFPLWRSKARDEENYIDGTEDEDEIYSLTETKLDKIAESYETDDDTETDEDLVV